MLVSCFGTKINHVILNPVLLYKLGIYQLAHIFFIKNGRRNHRKNHEHLLYISIKRYNSLRYTCTCKVIYM